MRYYIDDVDTLAKRFVWTKDGVDSFRILDAPTGKLRGDCDDFAVTALWLTEGQSMTNFWLALNLRRAVLWRVKGEGFASHMVLYHRQLGWIDNQNPEWGERKHKLRFPVPVTLIAAKMLIAKWGA